VYAAFVFAADTHILVAGRPDDITRMVNEG